MKENKLTFEQKRIDKDLYIILASALIILGLYTVFQNKIMIFVNDITTHILLRTFVSTLFQFGTAGLGITLVAVLRKENFFTYGLKKKGAFLSILFSTLCFLPHLIFLFATDQVIYYLPFQSVWVTREVLESSFPVNIIGLVLVTAAWGFFEGFNYVFICDKINKRYPNKNRWFNHGAIICAIMCVLIHGMIGVTPRNIIEMITVLIIIYGMLMVKEITENAWGCVFIFVFFWNAF